MTDTGTSTPGTQPAAFTRTTAPALNRSLTAAAQILNGPKAPPRSGRMQAGGKGLAWQQDAWQYYDDVGEFNYLIEWMARMVSRCRLVAAREQPGSDEPEIIVPPATDAQGEDAEPLSADDQLASDLVADFAGGQSGREQLMYRAAVQIQVAGESYVVGRQAPAPDRNPIGDPAGDTPGEIGEQRWDAYSNEEITRTGLDEWKVDDGLNKFELTPADVLIRVWRPHGKKRSEPNSASKSLRPVLAKIKGLTNHILAQIDSRLSGAGLLILPESMTFTPAQPKQSDGEGSDAGEDDQGDPFMLELIDYMLTSLKDSDSAARIVPIVIRVPDEAAGKAQYLRFDAPTDTKIEAVLTSATTRLARGFDAPPEALLGNSESNHWSAWKTSEDVVTASIAPLVAIVCHAFTIGWYRPALEIAGVAAPEEYSVWFDPTPLIVKPDRTEAATELYDRGELDGGALRREAGFDETDKPSGEALCRQLLLAVVRAKPEMAGAIVPMLADCGGVGALPLPPAPGEAQGDPAELEPGSGARDVPDPADARTTDPAGGGDAPGQQASAGRLSSSGGSGAAPCLAVACNVAVVRALEVAGKRMLTREHRGRLKDVPPHELHSHLPVADTDLDRLTSGAWGALTAALPGRPALVSDLDGYVRGLLTSGVKHDPEYVVALLAQHPDPHLADA